MNRPSSVPPFLPGGDEHHSPDDTSVFTLVLDADTTTLESRLTRKRACMYVCVYTKQGEKADDEEEVIMFDEPTAGLDPIASTVVEDLIRSTPEAGTLSRAHSWR